MTFNYFMKNCQKARQQGVGILPLKAGSEPAGERQTDSRNGSRVATRDVSQQ